MDLPRGISTPIPRESTAVVGGYDFEFVPALDAKYECAICLQALRVPMQTSCGHRFCKDCIENCMSDCISQCPIDKCTLSQGDLFHDQYVEREILQLKVKCPNESLGCNSHIDLKYVENHISACTYKPIMCPNECSAQVLFKSLGKHLSSECIYRVIRCPHCREAYKLNKEQAHFSTCPVIEVPCELCGLVMERKCIAQHRSNACHQAMANCPFAESGCLYRCSRGQMKTHVDSSQDSHLVLLMGAFKKMSTFIMDIHRNIPFSRQPSFRSDLSVSIPEADISPPLPSMDINSPGVTQGVNEASAQPKHLWDLNSYSQKAKDSLPNPDDLKERLRSHQNDKIPDDELTESPPKHASQERILRSLSDKAIDVNQRLLEQTIKIENLTRKVDHLETSLKQIQTEVSGKLGNGVFIWKIHNFVEFVEQMKSNGKLLQSPPFYSSGYKFYLRTNVTSTKDSSFLTLFIHMIQGENDDVLEWPFMGKINFSLLDCGESSPKKHIVEHMDIKKHFEAFQRPKHVRSGKGFGYKEFIPLSKIFEPSKGCFIKHDCLYIKAEVSVSDPTSHILIQHNVDVNDAQ